VSQRNTIRLVDVAREAGVHASTVSRVLNDSDRAAVRPETRERILAAALRMRYRPNVLARGLKTSVTATFGMLVPSLRNPVYADIVRGAVAEAARLGYAVVLAEDDSTITEQTWDRLVEEGRIDGILVASAAPGNPVLSSSPEVVCRTCSSTAAFPGAAATSTCGRATPAGSPRST